MTHDGRRISALLHSSKITLNEIDSVYTEKFGRTTTAKYYLPNEESTAGAGPSRSGESGNFSPALDPQRPPATPPEGTPQSGEIVSRIGLEPLQAGEGDPPTPPVSNMGDGPFSFSVGKNFILSFSRHHARLGGFLVDLGKTEPFYLKNYFSLRSHIRSKFTVSKFNPESFPFTSKNENLERGDSSKKIIFEMKKLLTDHSQFFDQKIEKIDKKAINSLQRITRDIEKLDKTEGTKNKEILKQLEKIKQKQVEC